jgi:hypothetical protein
MWLVPRRPHCRQFATAGIPAAGSRSKGFWRPSSPTCRGIPNRSPAAGRGRLDSWRVVAIAPRRHPPGDARLDRLECPRQVPNDRRELFYAPLGRTLMLDSGGQERLGSYPSGSRGTPETAASSDVIDFPHDLHSGMGARRSPEKNRPRLRLGARSRSPCGLCSSVPAQIQAVTMHLIPPGCCSPVPDGSGRGGLSRLSHSMEREARKSRRGRRWFGRWRGGFTTRQRKNR